MIPLRVTAHLHGPVRLPHGWLSLDSMLGAAICLRDNEPPLIQGQEPSDLSGRMDAVLKRSDCGRLWLASWSIGEADQYEKRWNNRRPPIAEAQAMGSQKVKAVNIAAGPMKAFHKPAEAVHMRGDRLDWFAIGDASCILTLLSLVQHLGAKRNAGDGLVGRWVVEPCEPWAGGFPVVLDGTPLRPLPPDWAGLDHSRCMPDRMPLMPPYWPRDPALRTDVVVPMR